MKKWIVVILCACNSAFAAVHPTRAQVAYFNEHDKCVSALKAARKDAKAAPPASRKALLDAAKQNYRQCEHHADLVWKFYPQSPPDAAASASH